MKPLLTLPLEVLTGAQRQDHAGGERQCNREAAPPTSSRVAPLDRVSPLVVPPDSRISVPPDLTIVPLANAAGVYDFLDAAGRNRGADGGAAGVYDFDAAGKDRGDTRSTARAGAVADNLRAAAG